MPRKPWPEGVEIKHVNAKTVLRPKLLQYYEGADWNRVPECYREIYPGLQIALDQRVAYYGSKGLPVPKFPDKIDTVRCIYGYVDVQRGVVRAGATGKVNSLVAPYVEDRPLWKRTGEHFIP